MCLVLKNIMDNYGSIALNYTENILNILFRLLQNSWQELLIIVAIKILSWTTWNYISMYMKHVDS